MHGNQLPSGADAIVGEFAIRAGIPQGSSADASWSRILTYREAHPPSPALQQAFEKASNRSRYPTDFVPQPHGAWLPVDEIHAEGGAQFRVFVKYPERCQGFNALTLPTVLIGGGDNASIARLDGFEGHVADPHIAPPIFVPGHFVLHHDVGSKSLHGYRRSHLAIDRFK